jgi:hypothetical protein
MAGADPNDWVRDFTAAMYADDAVRGWPRSTPTPAGTSARCTAGWAGTALGTRPLTNGVGLTLSYSRGGGDGLRPLRRAHGRLRAVTALSGARPPTSPYALIVVRTK